MTEKEKMLVGQLYQASDKHLVEERLKARQILFELNQLNPAQIGERDRLLALLFGKIAPPIQVESPFRCDYGYNIELGKNFFSNFNCTILDCAKVIIGDNVLFGPNVSIFTAGHPVDAARRNDGWEYALPVTIGNNVWIGGNVVINPAVTIGNNVVIGAGSVVTRSIPDDVVAAGNPCRVLRSVAGGDR
ncbi:sugar O-acetyltransferase [Mangrovibacterium marinum]|uniref:Acetyltransferase n=1 Tax=Mangrovibacterium marinum TaxID=1639118 RepID=A0A2T5C1G6_9BACT|nr:sugar O-acetyltransferase [Mangrovibacterium marinum]PTN08500.1 maltose O-acetyltransferase [Mangrovibacterium marinum]